MFIHTFMFRNATDLTRMGEKDYIQESVHEIRNY